MICRACKREHPPLMRCEVAARLIPDVVVNAPDLVVNSDMPLVVNKRTKDRHAKSAKRAEYMREYMRKRRAALQ